VDPRHFVIVGGGTCAGSAASTLRAEGFDGAVTIVSNEPMPPYERPPLSKDYLTGKTAAGDLAINPAGWYADHGVELLLDTHASRLDTASATLTLGGGRDLHYDALLLATGGLGLEVTVLEVHRNPIRLTINRHDAPFSSCP
jgi:3-phenylpropionate/trans-cinnamate dioxygenase ferredoxin reductase component